MLNGEAVAEDNGAKQAEQDTSAEAEARTPDVDPDKAPDPKRPKYGRRQLPADVEKLPPKLSCGTASGRGFFVAHPDPDMRPIVMLVKPDGSDLEEEDWLLVDADVEDELADVGTMYELVLCRTSQRRLLPVAAQGRGARRPRRRLH